jgi:hypothetical protein
VPDHEKEKPRIDADKRGYQKMFLRRLTPAQKSIPAENLGPAGVSQPGLTFAFYPRLSALIRGLSFSTPSDSTRAF